MVEILEGFPPEGRVVIDGYLVPNVSATIRKDGLVDVVLDRRFGVTVSREEFDRWLPIVAHAMAIGGGYSCFGENSTPMQPYKVQIHGIELLTDTTASA